MSVNYKVNAPLQNNTTQYVTFLISINLSNIKINNNTGYVHVLTFICIK